MLQLVANPCSYSAIPLHSPGAAAPSPPQHRMLSNPPIPTTIQPWHFTPHTKPAQKAEGSILQVAVTPCVCVPRLGSGSSRESLIPTINPPLRHLAKVQSRLGGPLVGASHGKSFKQKRLHTTIRHVRRRSPHFKSLYSRSLANAILHPQPRCACKGVMLPKKLLAPACPCQPHTAFLPHYLDSIAYKGSPFLKARLGAAAGCFGGHELLRLSGIQDLKRGVTQQTACVRHTFTPKIRKYILLRRGHFAVFGGILRIRGHVGNVGLCTGNCLSWSSTETVF